MPSLFSRKSSIVTTDEPVAGGVIEVTPPSKGSTKPRGYTPAKGKATPKRGVASRRAVEAPPASRREAYKRQRGRNREERAFAMEQQRAGNDAYLPNRDKGPERRLARNIVDRRRTLGPWLLLIMLVVFVFFSNPALPVVVQVFGQVLLTMTLVGTVLDSYLIARKVRREVRARFPKTTQRMGGLAFYAIMRAMQARRLRMPKVQRQIGDPLDDE